MIAALVIGIGITSYISDSKSQALRETLQESMSQHEVALHKFALKSSIHDQVTQQFNHCEKFDATCLSAVLSMYALFRQDKKEWEVVVAEFYSEFQGSFYNKLLSDKAFEVNER